MNKQQFEESEDMVLYNKPKKGLSDALEEHFDKSIDKLDKMFIIICKTRASYIKARSYHKKGKYDNSHNCRIHAVTLLESLHSLLTENFIIHK